MKNGENKKIKIFAVLTIITVIFVLFIFSNSMKDSAESGEMSKGFVDFFDPIFRKIFGENSNLNVTYIVRKCAHLAEFCVLGILVFSLVEFAEIFVKKELTFGGFFVVLAVAVFDEFIQSFSDRTSAVRDVLIDFVGACIGFLIVRAVICVFKGIKK